MTIEEARKVLEIEAEAIHALSARIDHRFEQMVEQIFQCSGRLIVS
ncbi:MAG: D-arabinose 5-phosphate isomerase, partial [Deltaproteobacteria bacterium]